MSTQTNSSINFLRPARLSAPSDTVAAAGRCALFLRPICKQKETINDCALSSMRNLNLCCWYFSLFSVLFLIEFFFPVSVFFLFSAGTNSGAHNESSCSSGPDSPHAKELEHLDGSGTAARAQYLSATCVVFTHYTGDTATMVDEHFSRALNFSNKDSKGESHSPRRRM